MKRLALVTGLVFCLVVAWSVDGNAQASKVGVFDMQKIVKESKKIEGYRQTLMKNLETKRKPLREKEEAVKLLDERLRKDGPNLSTADRTALGEKLGNEAKELRRLREDFDIEAQRMDRELVQKALKEVDGIVKKIGEKEGFTVILEKSAGGVVYFRDSVDVTAKIIQQLQ